MCGGASASRGISRMNPEYVWVGLVCLLVLVYLFYALLKPEKF